MSVYQLRVQRSLEKLIVPDWYRQFQVPGEGFLLERKSPREDRWVGTRSDTTSLSSLGYNTQTPCNQPFVQWSTYRWSSTASSPCASTRSRPTNGSSSSASLRSSFSYRQPYMGWRMQERRVRPKTPAERLASSLLFDQKPSHHQPQGSPEIQASIKDVASAIMNYVNDLSIEDNRDRRSKSQPTTSQVSNSVSPRGTKKVSWLESSLVSIIPSPPRLRRQGAFIRRYKSETAI